MNENELNAILERCLLFAVKNTKETGDKRLAGVIERTIVYFKKACGLEINYDYITLYLIHFGLNQLYNNSLNEKDEKNIEGIYQ